MKVLLLLSVLFSPLHAAEMPAFDPNTVLFIGSSTMELWRPRLAKDFPDIKTLDIGQGGTQFGDLLSHATEWARQYPARKIVVYSGDNDIAAGLSAQRVVRTARRLFTTLHRELPQAKIFVLAVKPAPARMNRIDVIRAVNRKLDHLHFAYLTYVDVHTPMLDANGMPRPELFRDDQIHMSDAGYEIWADLLRPLLQESR